MALYLKKHGVANVYPLAGGFSQWLESGRSTVNVSLDP